MYWFRTGSIISFLPWLLVALAWWMGGWLIVSHAFKLERRERLLAGFGVGMVLYLWAVNLVGRWVPEGVAFGSAVLFPVGMGLLLQGRGKSAWGDWFSWAAWQPPLMGLGLMFLILKVFQGVAIFDEFVHVPLVSVMAAGEMPPRYFINSRVLFAYHHGFHVLGASLMQLGGLFAWSATDLAKALAWGWAVALAWALGKRYVQAEWGGTVTALAVAFASGTRYLLLLAPQGVLARLNSVIVFQGDEALLGLPFTGMLSQFWRIEGGPPFPFLFGYQTGVAEPFVIQQTGSNTLAMLIFLLVWLLAGRAQKGWAMPVLAILLAFWALVAETSYGMFAVGGGLAGLWMMWENFKKDGTGMNAEDAEKEQESRRGHARPVIFRLLQSINFETYALLLSAPIALLQGGVLTEIVRGMLTGGDTGAAGFAWRWPPAILSKHLGALSLFSPLQLFVAFFELGPVMLFTPWITVWAWRKFRAGAWVFGALTLSAWVSFVFPIVLEYHSGPDISRVTAYGMTIWFILLAILVFEYRARWETWLRPAMGAALGLAVFGGFLLTASLVTGAPRTILTNNATEFDAEISAALWDQLPEEAEVFDPIRWRGPALFARLSHAVTGNQAVGYASDPAWDALVEDATVPGLLAEGYRYVYLDERWWRDLPETARQSLTQECVQVVVKSGGGETFRQLLDLEACQ